MNSNESLSIVNTVWLIHFRESSNRHIRFQIKHYCGLYKIYCIPMWQNISEQTINVKMYIHNRNDQDRSSHFILFCKCLYNCSVSDWFTNESLICEFDRFIEHNLFIQNRTKYSQINLGIYIYIYIYIPSISEQNTIIQKTVVSNTF